MKLYVLPTKIKIPSRKATQRKIGNRTTERLLLGRFIFFHRVVGVFSYTRYQGRQKQNKNRKLTKSSMKTRQFIFFTQLFGRVQFSRYKSLERFDAKTSKSFSLNALYYLIPSSLYQVRTESILSYFS